MHITTLSVKKFRNYDYESLNLCPSTNVFYGNNAQGKTNLLEAVYLFSHGKSHRAKTDAELVKFGENVASLNLLFSDSGRDYNALIRLSSNGKKQVKVNNVPIKKLSMLMSYLNVVMFSPEDLEIIKGSPSSRRHFIDEAISQIYPNYLSKLISYHKVMLEKNSLLKILRSSGKSDDTMISVWNEQLAEFGSAIYKYRLEFLEQLNEFTKPIHKDISKEEFLLKYQPGIKIAKEDDIKGSFYNSLEQNKKREIEFGACQVGIQRDDFKIFTNDKETRIFGSQGQQRTSILSMKMAQTEYINSIRCEYPVLLLDDIMSELDIKRRSFLWERITDKQVLITCTDTDVIKNSDNIAFFKVKEGRIIK